MANGTALPIEQVHTGDLVMSRDAATGATAAKRVLSTSVRPVDNTLDVHVGGETIHTTRNHPFAVKGYGFVPAGQLAKSDRLQTEAGTLLAPQSFHAVTVGGSALVYNFVVADWHTYFVGQNHIWVHNGWSCSEQKVADYLKALGRDVKENPLEGVKGAGRQGDAFVNGVKTEFKSLDPGATAKTIQNRVNDSVRRGGQARNIVIDARGSGLSEEAARQGIFKALGISRDRLDYLTVIGDDYFIGYAPKLK